MTNEIKDIVLDWDFANRFIESLPELKNDEVYFLSLSARNKYLDDEERKRYQLQKTEMFSRKVVRSKEQFVYVLRELSAILAVRQTKSGYLIPEKCRVVYVNLNPSSMVRAFMLFQNEMNKRLSEVYQSTLRGTTPNYDSLRLADRKLMNCIQKSRAYNHYIDIDADAITKETYSFMYKEFELMKLSFDIVQTQGGYHFLIYKSSMKKGMDKKLNEIRGIACQQAIEDGGEVVFNNNKMIPFPGTLQAGKLVKFITGARYDS